MSAFTIVAIVALVSALALIGLHDVLTTNEKVSNVLFVAGLILGALGIIVLLVGISNGSISPCFVRSFGRHSIR